MPRIQPVSLRRAIVFAMKKRKWTRYRLAKELKGKVSPTTVYNFVGGSRKSIDVNAAERMMEVLGIFPAVNEESTKTTD